jgi:hypothetical protein
MVQPRQISRSARLAAIEELPGEMQEYALVDWETVAVVTGNKDVEYAREELTKAGVPLVQVSARRRLPTWASLREFLKSREIALS